MSPNSSRGKVVIEPKSVIRFGVLKERCEEGFHDRTTLDALAFVSLGFAGCHGGSPPAEAKDEHSAKDEEAHVTVTTEPARRGTARPNRRRARAIGGDPRETRDPDPRRRRPRSRAPRQARARPSRRASRLSSSTRPSPSPTSPRRPRHARWAQGRTRPAQGPAAARGAAGE